MSGRVVVAGLGTEFRHDDGVGVAVARRVAERGAGACDDLGASVDPVADPLDLLGLWDHAALAVVVDATRSGATAGTIRVIEILRDTLGEDPGAASTHSLGVGAVLKLARAVGCAPRRVVVVGIEGEDFTTGVGLSPAVRRAVDTATDTVLGLISEVRSCA